MKVLVYLILFLNLLYGVNYQFSPTELSSNSSATCGSSEMPSEEDGIAIKIVKTCGVYRIKDVNFSASHMDNNMIRYSLYSDTNSSSAEINTSSLISDLETKSSITGGANGDLNNNIVVNHQFAFNYYVLNFNEYPLYWLTIKKTPEDTGAFCYSPEAGGLYEDVSMGFWDNGEHKFHVDVSAEEINPMLVSGSYANLNADSITVSITLDKNSNLYWIVVPQGSTLPTSSQVVAEANYSGVTIVSSGNRAVESNISNDINITGLTGNTSYTVHFVAKDSNNYMSCIISVNFTTTNNITTTNTILTFSNLTKSISNVKFIDLRVDENLTLDFNSTDANTTITHVTGADRFFAIKLTTTDGFEWLYSDTNITLLSDVNFSANDFNATYGFAFSNANYTKDLNLIDSKWVFAKPNILLNSDAELGNLTGWNITLNGGNGWIAGTSAPHSGTYAFESSFAWDEMYQLIDLQASGFDLTSLPTISVGIWVQSRFDAASQYYIAVELLDSAQSIVGSWYRGSQSEPIALTAETSWFLEEHNFSAYPASAKYIKFLIGGKDQPWWAGNFGTQFDDAYITVNAPQGTPIITPSPTPAPVVSSGGGDVYIEPQPAPTTSSSLSIANDNVNVITNSDGSQTLKMSSSVGTFEATISKDGSGSVDIAVSSTSGESIKTEINLGSGTKTAVAKDGTVTFSSKTSTGTTLSLSPKSDGSGVKSSVKLPNGKAIDIAVPSGAKVTMDEKGLKQEFETKEGKTNVTFTPDGKMNVSIQSSDGKSININSTVEAEISVNNDGSITQIMDLGEMVATVVASKRAEIKGSFESKDGSKTDVNAPKGSNVTASEDEVSISSADSSYLTNLDVKTDGSVEIEIGSTARADRESIKYSSRAGASDIKAKVLFPNQTSLRRVGASGRAEVEYSMRGAIANSLNRSDSTITITPKEQIAVKETIGFDGASSIETNGTASLNGSLDDKSFNMSNSDCVTLNSDGSFEASKESNDTTAKLSSDSSGNLNIKLEFDNKNRALSGRESFSYSPRRGISDLKVDVIMGDTNRRVDSDRVNLEYSSARRLIFETIQRDSSKVEIVPNSDAKFEENIYMDTNRTIKLIAGSSQIVINGESQAMILNQEYQLPNIETELDSSYKSKTIQTKTTLKEGWNLIGSPISSDITDPFIFGNFDTIWLYDDRIWYKNPDSISYHLGFWVKANESNDINFSGTTYRSDLTSFSNGWSLIAVGDGFESNKTLKDYYIESAWKYENQTYTEIKSLDSLTQGSGVWIKREQPKATLSIEKGWNLKAPPTIEDIIDTSIFKDFDFIYVYRDSKWVENPSSIKSGEGFWIYSYVAQEMPFYSQTYDANLSDLNGTTWNLKGGYINNANSTGREIWVYRYDNWFSNKLNNLTTVNSGDGFFVK